MLARRGLPELEKGARALNGLHHCISWETMGKSLRSKQMRRNRAELRRTVHAPAEARRQARVNARMRKTVAGGEKPGATLSNLKAVLAGEAPEPEEIDLEEKPARFSFKEMMIPSSALPVEDVATAANARLAKAREEAAEAAMAVDAVSATGRSGKAPRRAQTRRAARLSSHVQFYAQRKKGEKNTINRAAREKAGKERAHGDDRF